MSSSLRDQLVKAGLATAGQAKKAEREQQQAQRRGKGGQSKSGKGGKRGKSPTDAPPDTSPEGLAKARARQLQQQKAARDRAIAKVRNEKSAEKARRAQIKQLIAQNDVRAKEARDDDLPYNFVHGKKIKKIYLPKQQVEELSAGRLVIVNNDGRYHIVSQKVAQQISERDPKWIVAAHDQAAGSASGASEEDDEYYKRFEVPDDLDW